MVLKFGKNEYIMPDWMNNLSIIFDVFYDKDGNFVNPRITHAFVNYVSLWGLVNLYMLSLVFVYELVSIIAFPFPFISPLTKIIFHTLNPILTYSIIFDGFGVLLTITYGIFIICDYNTMKRDELLRREYYKGHCEGTNLGWNKAEEAMMRVFTEKLRQKKIILKPEVETIEMMMHVVSSLLQRRYLEKYDANESVIDTITIRWKEIGIEE